MTRRYYSSIAQATTLSAGCTDSAGTMLVTAAIGFPSSLPWTGVVDKDQITEEIVTVTARSSTTLTVTRGVGGTSGVAHNSGATFAHVVYSQDFEDAAAHIAASAAVHGLAGTVVGTTDTQALTNKTIVGSSNTISAIAESSVTNLVSDLAAKIPKSQIAAKGDIVTGTASATPSVLTAGSDYQIVQARAGATNGIEYVTAGMRLTGTKTIASGTPATDFFINSCFRSAGIFYRIIYSLTGSGVANVMNRMRVSGVDNSASSYYDSAGTSAGTSNIIGTLTTTTGWGYVDVFFPATAQPTTFIGPTAASITAPSVANVSGAHNVSTAYDGFSWLLAGGATMYGEVRVYELAGV